jgi:hypothetical protein
MQQAVRLIRLLRRERAEIVHSHDAYTSVFGTICARLAGVRGVIASRRSWYSPHLRGEFFGRIDWRTGWRTAFWATARASPGSSSPRAVSRRRAS